MNKWTQLSRISTSTNTAQKYSTHYTGSQIFLPHHHSSSCASSTGSKAFRGPEVGHRPVTGLLWACEASWGSEIPGLEQR